MHQFTIVMTMSNYITVGQYALVLHTIRDPLNPIPVNFTQKPIPPSIPPKPTLTYLSKAHSILSILNPV